MKYLFYVLTICCYLPFSSAFAQEVGDIYYADGTVSAKKEIGKSPVGVVLDFSESNLLILSTEAEKSRSWQKSIDFCAAYSVGRNVPINWHLPTLRELLLLKNLEVAQAVDFVLNELDSRHLLEEGFYWSADEAAVKSVYAMGVSLPDGAISKLLKTKYYNLRCFSEIPFERAKLITD